MNINEDNYFAFFDQIKELFDRPEMFASTPEGIECTFLTLLNALDIISNKEEDLIDKYRNFKRPNNQPCCLATWTYLTIPELIEYYKKFYHTYIVIQVPTEVDAEFSSGPARQEITVLSGDDPNRKPIGWTVREKIGIAITNRMLYPGMLVRIKPEAWQKFLKENNMNPWQEQLPCHIDSMPNHPLYHNKVLLKYPFHWWDESDIIPIDKDLIKFITEFKAIDNNERILFLIKEKIKDSHMEYKYLDDELKHLIVIITGRR